MTAAGAAAPGPVALALAADGAASGKVAAELFPEAARVRLSREELRPRAPFAGTLFELLAAQPRGACVGLVVPLVSAPEPRAGRELAGREPATPPSAGSPPAPPAGGALAPPRGKLLAVADHVNLELRGPLSGRWPAAVPRDFPCVAGIYQPAVVRARGGPRVYSGGVAVAGVADAGRLTPFESGVIFAEGIVAVSDTLVPPAIVAAYYGLTLAACGVPPAADNDGQ